MRLKEAVNVVVSDRRSAIALNTVLFEFFKEIAKNDERDPKEKVRDAAMRVQMHISDKTGIAVNDLDQITAES